MFLQDNKNYNRSYNSLIAFVNRTEETSSSHQTEETAPRKIRLFILILVGLFVGILFSALYALSIFTHNFELGRVILIIFIVFILSGVLLGFSSKEPTKFQPSLKELYRKLFKDAPNSYFIFGFVILIGMNLGILGIYTLFACVKWDNVSCDVFFCISSAIFMAGIILAAIGLFLSVKKGLRFQKKEIVQSEAQRFMEYLRKNAFPELVEEKEVRSYIQELNSAWEDAEKLEKANPQSLSDQEVAWQDKKKALMTFLDQLHLFIAKKQFHSILLQKETMVGQLTSFLQVYTPTIYKEFMSKTQRISDSECQTPNNRNVET